MVNLTEKKRRKRVGKYIEDVGGTLMHYTVEIIITRMSQWILDSLLGIFKDEKLSLIL